MANVEPTVYVCTSTAKKIETTLGIFLAHFDKITSQLLANAMSIYFPEKSWSCYNF